MNIIAAHIKKPLLVVEITSEEIGRRLCEHGIYKGISITKLAQAPFGGPLMVSVDDISIAIRRVEAKYITVVEHEE